ncbi:MAG: methylmalonyl Co-A mutase-associated GTPase MeaB [Humibacillus sp.]|nr:methylmalonyl Co-A mutase-associated GTPase MeaB [Humibacillus sp.]MDN5779263.1 methylmalonyl Co-A mutase-associated GTPase MeaB [Humibacillus sp.]
MTVDEHGSPSTPQVTPDGIPDAVRPGSARRRAAVDVDALVAGVVAGNRADVARAITLVESSRADHRAAARVLLERLAASGRGNGTDSRVRTGLTVRVGISGVPGVGKSTFIETLGRHLIADGHRVGVLAVDPSSVRTGGSVLGDKTRMADLAADPRAFIRPSPSAGTLGGVARATAQAMSVLEAARHDVVIVETVGVGQSEVTVAGMVDTFLFLTLARTGDQLQGIKKGIVEIADVVAVNKADEERENEAKVAARQLAGALRLVHGAGEWAPSVVTCSALTDVGVTQVWEKVLAHREHVGPVGIARRRAEQQLDLAWALVRDELDRRLLQSPGVARVRGEVRDAVLSGALSAPAAADRILAAWDDPTAAHSDSHVASRTAKS